MVYPGLPGQIGPPPQTAVGQQIRQSTAGSYPGGKTYTTVVDAMGPNAPATAIEAEQITVAQEVAAFPHPIEDDDFESAAWEEQVDANLLYDG